MPEASDLVASSFPMQMRSINDLCPVNESEELRVESRESEKASQEAGKDIIQKNTCNFMDQANEEMDYNIVDDYGFFPLDDDEGFQGGKPDDQRRSVMEDTVSTSGSESSTDHLATSHRKKSALKRISTYGDANEGIPLDFERTEFNRVLPKPDLYMQSSVASGISQKSGSRGLFRVSSEPVFVRPVFKSDDDGPEVESDRPVNSVPSGGFIEGAMKKRISFGTIQIREHGQTIGDNPSCSYGTPVSLDWDHQDLEELNMEEYELCRSRQRTKQDFHMNHFQRSSLLKMNGHSTNEIKESKNQVRKARNQRERTRFLALNYPQLVTVEDAIESGLRKVKRTVSKSKLNKIGDTGKVPKKSSKDDLSLYDGISKQVLLAKMDDISNVTAPF